MLRPTLWGGESAVGLLAGSLALDEPARPKNRPFFRNSVLIVTGGCRLDASGCSLMVWGAAVPGVVGATKLMVGRVKAACCDGGVRWL